MQFVERIAALTKEKGITEKQVLLDCKLNKNLFGLWRQGRMPSTATKRVLADYFGVSVEYLMGETDDRAQKNSPGQVTEAKEKIDAIMKIYDMLTPENKERFSDSLSEILSALIKEQLQG
jgi:transcriptional regulator with XRE-family HTH domain